MIATKERAAAISRARRAVKLLIEHDAPTQQDLGAARDRLNECYNLPEPTQIWDAVHQIEDSAAKTYGVPDVDQARVAETAVATPNSGSRPAGQTVWVEPQALSTPPSTSSPRPISMPL